MPKKTCPSCSAKCVIAVRVCGECGAVFKSKTKRNWAGVAIPAKTVYKPVTSGRPAGRAPAGKKWDAKGKKWVDDSSRSVPDDDDAPVSTGRPRGRPPAGKTWDASGKKWVDDK